MIQTLAALLTGFNRPLSLDWLETGLLGYGQVLVRVIASGICGAQINEIKGEKNPDMPLPRLLGHEGIGVVEEIGYGVKRVKAGDRVCMHWRKGEGIDCEPPYYSKKFGEYTPSDFVIRGGQVVTFATRSICSENRLTVVPSDCPDELAMLLGCSMSTALGVVENEADIRFGESVLVIGCGGLGLNLILAAKLRQAGRIVATDIIDSKRGAAEAMGAEYRDGLFFGAFDMFDVIIETSGVPDALEWSSRRMAPSGRLIMVGQPPPHEGVSFPSFRHMFEGSGKRIIATQGGRFSPTRDIPRYVAMWRAGRLDLDGIISHRLPLSRINEGLDLVRNGHAGRVLIDCASE